MLATRSTFDSDPASVAAFILAVRALCVWHTYPDLAQFTTLREALADLIGGADSGAVRIAPEVEAAEPPTTEELRREAKKRNEEAHRT